MKNAVRSELMALFKMIKEEDKNNKDFYLKLLFEEFENDINKQLKNLECEKEELLENKELIKIIKETLKK